MKETSLNLAKETLSLVPISYRSNKFNDVGVRRRVRVAETNYQFK